MDSAPKRTATVNKAGTHSIPHKHTDESVQTTFKARNLNWKQWFALIAFVLIGSVFILIGYEPLENQIYLPVDQTYMDILNQSEAIIPIPLYIELDPRKVALGDHLFHDPILSHDNTVSCASCHDLQKGGTDQRKVSIGIEKKLGPINSPTVFNAGFNFVQFWDGRALTLEEQVEGPVHNSLEMGSNWSEVVEKIKNIPRYVAQFEALYNEGVAKSSIEDAIATFEKSLYTPNSDFDTYLRGDESALTPDEKQGYQLFLTYGCVSCHQGILLGGNLFQKIGVMQPYFVHETTEPSDLGRFNVTKKDKDRFYFKVPTLRNVEITFPYLHDGEAATLEEVLSVMFNAQIGRGIPENEIYLLVAFLKTLTGEYKGKKLTSTIE